MTRNCTLSADPLWVTQACEVAVALAGTPLPGPSPLDPKSRLGGGFRPPLLQGQARPGSPCWLHLGGLEPRLGADLQNFKAYALHLDAILAQFETSCFQLEPTWVYLGLILSSLGSPKCKTHSGFCTFFKLRYVPSST